VAHGETRTRAWLSNLRGAGASLCALALGLTAFSFVTVEHIKTGYLAHRAAPSLHFLLGLIRPLDLAIIAATALAGIALVAIEWRGRGLTHLLNGRAPRWQRASLLCLMIWYSHAVLLPGLLVTGDAGSHVARVSHLAMALRNGSSLYWDNFIFGGGTLLQNTGPVFHWLAALTSVATGDPTLGVKLVSFAARLLAGVFMFAYLRRIGLARAAAFLGAAFFTGAYYMSYIVSIRGKFPQELHFTAFAATLFCLEGVLRAQRWFNPNWFGFCLASIVMIGNHQPTAVMAAVLLGLYTLARMWSSADFSATRRLLAAGAVIAAGACCFLLPIAIERAWTAQASVSDGQINETDAVFAFVWPNGHALLNDILWGRGGEGPVSTAYLGLTLIALAACGALLYRRAAMRGSGAAQIWAIAGALTVLSVFMAGTEVRPTVFTFTFLCAAAACGADMLFTALPAKTWFPVLVFALFSLDAGPAPLQPYNRTDMRAISNAGAALAERAAGQRVFEVNAGPTKGSIYAPLGPGATPLDYAYTQHLDGPHNLEATKAHNAMEAALNIAADDLRAHGTLGADARLLLAQYNVGWMVGFDGPVPGLPSIVRGATPDPVLGRYQRLPDPTPVLAAARIVRQARPESFDGKPYWNRDFEPGSLYPGAADAERQDIALTKQMGIDVVHRTAAVLLMPVLPQDEAFQMPDGPAPHITLSEYKVESGKVSLHVQSDRPAFLRLAHPVFPGLMVIRNGLPSVFAADVFSMIVLPIEAGPNDIALTVAPSRLRLTCLAISALVFASLLAGMTASLFRPRP